jgi:hypothetical protein
MARLTGLRLPDESRFLRRVPVAKKDDADFVAAFDRHTLFYDVFHDPGTGTIRIVAPSLRTQRRLFRQMVVKVDGHRIELPEIQLLSPRTSQIAFPSPVEEPKTLRLAHRGTPKLNAQVPIGRANTEKFAGKNALVAISKNNELVWIKDWLRYYVSQHGANALVLIDNGSDRYPLRDLRRAILSVEGIEALEIVSAPFPFGPKGVDRISVNAKFLHLSALHIAHTRFLGAANAVLSVDIDELVTKPDDQTVFEAVKASEDGFLSIGGTWRYARKPDKARPIRHAEHVLRRIGPDARMQPKWCVDPTGPLAGRYWRTHGVAQAKPNHAHGFRYLHCRQITTNWDYDRAFEPEDRFEEAPEAAALTAAFA